MWPYIYTAIIMSYFAGLVVLVLDAAKAGGYENSHADNAGRAIAWVVSPIWAPFVVLGYLLFGAFRNANTR